MDQFKIKKTVLSNGLTVLYCHTPRSVCFEMTMHINTGSRDEVKSQSGVSHFLEHMLGICTDSKTHFNILGILLDPQYFQIIFNYLKHGGKL